MDIEVSEENACKILRDVRELLKDNILPRLLQLEQEVRLLRAATWPVCQSLRETSQLTDCGNKKQFLQCLDPEEAHRLLLDKADVSKKPIEYSTSHFLRDELFTCRCERCSLERASTSS